MDNKFFVGRIVKLNYILFCMVIYLISFDMSDLILSPPKLPPGKKK